MKRIIIMLVLAVSLGTNAQDSDNTHQFLAPCGDMSESDCDILLTSEIVMAELESVRFALNMEMGIENAPDLPDSAVMMEVSGVYKGNWSRLVTNLSADRITTIASNPMGYAALVHDALTSFSAHLTFQVTIPPEGQPETISIEMLLNEGIFYLNFNTLKEQLPPEETEELPTGWVGFGFARWIALFAGINAALTDEAELQQELLQQIEATAIANQFAVAKRLEDVETADGGSFAVFEICYDVPAMLRSPEYQELMVASMQVPDLESSRRLLAGMNTLFEVQARMAQSLTLCVTQKIDPETYYSHEASFEFAIDFSPVLNSITNTIGNLASRLGGREAETPLVVGPSLFMRGTAQLTDFNAITSIEIPENAEVLDFASLIELLEG